MPEDRELPDKLFFRIGEVAEIVGVKPHVLRYWEEEFPALRPKKTRGAHRHYARKDVELAMLIRKLLHDEGFTVPGAKKRLRQLGHHVRSRPSEPGAAREVALRAELVAVRDLLVELLDELDRGEEQGPAESSGQLKVHAPATVVAPSRRA